MSQGLRHAHLWRQCIAPHLRCVDLCTLMQLSEEWFFFWIDDRSWVHQRNRVCARFPALQDLFKAHAAPPDLVSKARKRNGKKRKTAWLMLRSGIWHVFGHFLSQCENGPRFELICQEPALEPLIISALLTNVPHEENVFRWKITRLAQPRYGSRLFIIRIWTKTGSWVQFTVTSCHEYVYAKASFLGPPFLYCWAFPPPYIYSGLFHSWSCFVLQRVCEPRWTPEFENAMKGK